MQLWSNSNTCAGPPTASLAFKLGDCIPSDGRYAKIRKLIDVASHMKHTGA